MDSECGTFLCLFYYRNAKWKKTFQEVINNVIGDTAVNKKKRSIIDHL